MKRMEVSCVLKHLWKPFGMAYPIAIQWTWVLLGPYSHGLINVLSLIQSGAVWTDFVGTVNGAILRPGLGSNIWLSRARIMCQFFSIFEVSWRSYKDVNKDHGILMLTGSGRKNVRRWFEMVGNQRWRQIALTDCLVGLRLANWGCANGPWIYTIIRENASKIFRSNYMRSLLHHRQNRPGQRGWHFGQNSRRCIRMRIFSGANAVKSPGPKRGITILSFSIPQPLLKKLIAQYMDCSIKMACGVKRIGTSEELSLVTVESYSSPRSGWVYDWWGVGERGRKDDLGDEFLALASLFPWRGTLCPFSHGCSLGADGFLVIFFQKYWHLISSNITTSVLDFLNLHHLPQALNYTFFCPYFYDC